MLTYSVPNSGLLVPIKIKTDVCFAILIDELPICVFDRDEILCSRPIDMDQHSIKNVKNPADRLDAVSKAYADRITCKTATGNIPNTVMTDHTHCRHLTFAQGYYTIESKGTGKKLTQVVGSKINSIPINQSGR